RIYIFFFFSSRRRHTRFSRDWSSDVCSSDLGQGLLPQPGRAGGEEEIISPQRTQRAQRNAENRVGRAGANCQARPTRFLSPFFRSEERRVGKECRSRRWARH